MGYRKLTDKEVAVMKAAGCRAADWNSVEVAWGGESFADRIRETEFSGTVRLGRLGGEFLQPSGVSVPCGLSRCVLHNVTLGDGCAVRNVRGAVANYSIGDGCLIDDVHELVTEGESPFGNGTVAPVLSEAGGREVIITEALSSQTAWLMTLDGEVAGRVRNLFSVYADSIKSSCGAVGNGSVIRNCGILRNLRLGEASAVEGAAFLSEGTVLSSREAPSRIGTGVRAANFIAAEGSVIEDGADVKNCYIGQACHMGGGFSAENSVFFGDCVFEKGEACSVFAGPFSVSHHKSTLLIAGMFSFFNAGSGSNQSNHMYKTGPVHYGRLGRGCTLASGSHILWPMTAGPFTLIMGHVVSHPDTSAFPFSYLIEREGKTWLYPGVNLFKAGTARSFEKWPARDARKAPFRDMVSFGQLNPYTAGLMAGALSVLEGLRASGVREVYAYGGAFVKAKDLEKGLGCYRTGILACMEKYLQDCDPSAVIAPAVSAYVPEKWCDAGGLIVPESEIAALEEGILSGNLCSPSELGAAFAGMASRVPEQERNWAQGMISSLFPGRKVSDALAECAAASEKIRAAVAEDAEKDRKMAGIL